MAKRIRLGMVGGGQGAFIGEVHRLAARLDNRFELCAGALEHAHHLLLLKDFVIHIVDALFECLSES